MKNLVLSYRWINLLSLDVAAGAVVSGLFFARIFHVHVLPWGLATLGLTVWIIYTADHLLDARQLKSPASSARRRFHQQYFRPLVSVLIFALLIDFALIFLLRISVLKSGIVLGVVVGVYLLIQRNLKSFKELSGSFLYCAGIALPALALTDLPTSAFPGWLMTQFVLIVLCNMLLFSLFDLHEDLADHQNSFATVMGRKKTRFVLFLLFALNGLLTIFQLIFFSNAIGPIVVMMMMYVSLLCILVFQRFFESNGLYRLLGDAVFLFPLPFLLL